ncbi:MAG: polysaccharide biosynthesis C-terminal domain-containing protein [Lachnospiraceae bacterium]|nr:polysaccharide biosynthesis C-terminal domain-containing protein [Lachnospiraceae bacterium]
MDEKKRMLKNTGLIALGNAGVKVMAFLLLPLYTSIVSTEEYGQYDFIVAVSVFLLPIITCTMYEAMFRFIIDGKNDKDFKKIITNSFLIISLGVVLFGAVTLVIYAIFKISIVILIWIYVVASALYTYGNYLLRGLGKIKEYALITSVKNILQLVINIIVIAFFRWGMYGLLFSMCVTEILAFIVTFVYSKLSKYIKVEEISVKEIKDMLNYSLPLVPNALCAQIINVSDRFVISMFMGSSANGIYSVSYKFPNIIETVYHYFYTAWSESASRIIAKGKEEAKKYYQTLYFEVSNFIFAVVIMMISGMAIMFRLFVRGDYTEGFNYIPILMFAMYFDCISKFYAGVFTALKETKLIAKTTVIAAACNIIINVVLINKIGLYAAAISTLVSEILMTVLRSRKIKEAIGIREDNRANLVKLVVAIVVCGLYHYNNWIRIIAGIIIATAFSIVNNRKIIVAIIKKK